MRNSYGLVGVAYCACGSSVKVRAIGDDEHAAAATTLTAFRDRHRGGIHRPVDARTAATYRFQRHIGELTDARGPQRRHMDAERGKRKA